MAGYLVEDARKVTTRRLQEMKDQGRKIAMLTAYDYTTARIVDGAGVDAILVGDSAANVMAGYQTTLPITLDQMIYHAASVVRGVKRALVVCDMPFVLRIRMVGVFVAAAKRKVFGKVGIDMIAGPSEILVLADGSCNPAWVAADLLSQAEHDKLASPVLVTDSWDLAKAVQAELEVQIPQLPRAAIVRASVDTNGKIIVTDDMNKAIEAMVSSIASAINVCDIETVVLGGVWSQFGSEIAVQMQSALQRQVLGYPEVRAKVLMADVTSRPALVGAAAMGLRHFVDDPMRFVSA